MRSWVRSFAAVIAAFGLLGSPAEGGEQTPVDGTGLRFLQTLDQRIADISWKLASASSDWCPERMNSIGVTVHNLAQYAPRYRQAAITSFGFVDGLPMLLAVANGGPADLAGIRQGDRLVAIDGVRFAATASPQSAKADYASIDAVMSRLENLPADSPAAVDLIRGNDAHRLTITPRTICRSRVEIVPSQEINASSDGFIVQIYGRLALWTKNDDELAIVVAHEMAHNILGHNARIKNERIETGILAGFGSNGRKLRDFEREADRYGLYLAAQAGYDYRLAPDFWRRLSMASGLGNFWATTHPTGANREKFNVDVINEIAKRKESHSSLTPYP